MTTTQLPDSDEQRRYYNFHGTGISVTADRPDLLEIMHIRLRHFAVEQLPGAADLTFIFQGTDDAKLPSIEKPAGDSRRVYGLSWGDIVYSDAQEQLYLDRGFGFKALCLAGEGLARIVIPAGSDKLQLATHQLFNYCLYELLKRRGFYNIHAAGLSIADKGLVISGISGAGKSTLCVALLRAGFGFLGDDTLFLTRSKDGIRALAFPDVIDVTEQTTGFFAELPAFSEARKNLRNKTQVAAEQVYQCGWVESCFPRVLLFPHVANKSTSVLKPIGPQEMLLELATHIILTDPRSSQAHLDALGGLIRQCDCYRLETGRDFDTLPGRLRELLG